MTTEPDDELVEAVVKAVRAAIAVPPTPLAYRPDDAARLLSIGRGPFYELLAEGKIRARKAGSRTLILRDDLVAYLESLPTWDGA